MIITDITNKEELQIHVVPNTQISLHSWKLDSSNISIGKYNVILNITYTDNNSEIKTPFNKKISKQIQTFNIDSFGKEQATTRYIDIKNKKWINLDFLDWKIYTDINVNISVVKSDEEDSISPTFYIWRFRLISRTPEDMTVVLCGEAYPDENDENDKDKIMYWRTNTEYGKKCRLLISELPNKESFLDGLVDNFCILYKYSDECKCINRNLYKDYTNEKSKKTNIPVDDYCWYEPCKSGQYLVKHSDKKGCFNNICEVSYDIKDVGGNTLLRDNTNYIYCGDYKKQPPVITQPAVITQPTPIVTDLNKKEIELVRPIIENIPTKPKAGDDNFLIKFLSIIDEYKLVFISIIGFILFKKFNT